MSNSWFRMYHEFATDPKIQMLSEAYQRRFVMVLCLRCCNDDVTLQDEEIAFQLRISNEEWSDTKKVFLDKGLINGDNNPANWDKRQFVSDSSAERVRRHRAKKSKQQKTQCNVTVTPPDTDTDTDTDIKKTKQKKSALDYSCWPSMPSEQVYSDWVEMRKRKKANVTQTVINSFGKELCIAAKHGFTVDQCLSECIASNWQGFKAEWLVGRVDPADRKIFLSQSQINNKNTRDIPLSDQINDRSWAMGNTIDGEIING